MRVIFNSLLLILALAFVAAFVDSRIVDLVIHHMTDALEEMGALAKTLAATGIAEKIIHLIRG